MSSREFSEWMAFFSLQPYGEWREDYRMAVLASLIANANSDPKKGRRYRPEDFMPKFGEQDEPETDVVAAKIDAYFSALAMAGNKVN